MKKAVSYDNFSQQNQLSKHKNHLKMEQLNDIANESPLDLVFFYSQPLAKTIHNQMG